MAILHLAQTKDLPTLLRFVQSYYAFDGLPFDEAAIRKGLAVFLSDDCYGKGFLIEHEGQLVGYTLLTYAFDLEFGGRIANITDLFIEASHRRQGLGTQAIQALEAIARAEGLGALELQVEQHNAHARSLYQKIGFKAYSRTPMSKTLG